jgi:3-methyladenine DNA glycosylase AlkD
MIFEVKMVESFDLKKAYMNLVEQILARMKENSDPEAIVGMAKVGINPDKTWGVKIPVLRDIAKQHKRQHNLALLLWETGIHEAKILASMVDDPKILNNDQMETWLKGFDSWDVCDQVIMNLFEKHNLAWQKAVEWSKREPEFEKRAGYVMMARLAVSDKKAPDSMFIDFFPLLREGAKDNRNMVKKAVNWAIRQIGKRNFNLNKLAIELSEEIQRMEIKSTKWIAADALRELTNDKIRARLK